MSKEEEERKRQESNGRNRQEATKWQRIANERQANYDRNQKN